MNVNRRSVLRLQQRRHSRDVDCDRSSGQFQMNIDFGILTHAQRNARLLMDAHSGSSDCERVIAGRQIPQNEPAFVIGTRGKFEPLLLIVQHRFRAGNHRARRVIHNSGKRSAVDLCLRGFRQREEYC